jgi:glycosyltransferase involved in cell wall biosynthesis
VPLKRRRGGAAAYIARYGIFLGAAFLLLAARSLRRRFDLIHVHNMPDALVFSALVPKLLGAKIILDLHDPMPELMMTIFGLKQDSPAIRLLKRIERWSATFADQVITVNVACKRILVSRSCSPEKVNVVMNSPDEDIFALQAPTSPNSFAGRPFVIMYHGSILERNGLDLAVNALAAVRGHLSSVELRIYGEATPFLTAVMKRVREHGLQNSVRYFGAPRPEQIAAAIDECDVGIIPNRRTVFTEINTPTRIFEYLSRGKPVIAGRAPGVQDYFPDDALFFFELGNVEDLARAIVYVFDHPSDVEKTVRRGQDVYLDHRWSDERGRMLVRMAELLHG